MASEPAIPRCLKGRAIDPTELKQLFSLNGYVIIKEFLPLSILQSAQEELQTLVDQTAERLLSEGYISSTFKEQPFSKRLMKVFETNPHLAPKIYRSELHLKGLFPLFFHPPLLDLIEALLGTEEIRLYPNYTVRPKLPGNVKHEVLWHQDAGYTKHPLWHAERELSEEEILKMARSMVNVWTPLVPATEENGCMQFVVKSHTVGIQRHLHKGEYLELDKESLDQMTAHNPIINVQLNPGDIVLFQQLLFHRGLPNRSDHVRWSFDFRFQNASFSTLRQEKGHMARSKLHPELVVQNGEQWETLELGGTNPR